MAEEYNKMKSRKIWPELFFYYKKAGVPIIHCAPVPPKGITIQDIIPFFSGLISGVIKWAGYAGNTSNAWNVNFNNGNLNNNNKTNNNYVRCMRG